MRVFEDWGLAIYLAPKLRALPTAPHPEGDTAYFKICSVILNLFFPVVPNVLYVVVVFQCFEKLVDIFYVIFAVKSDVVGGNHFCL